MVVIIIVSVWTFHFFFFFVSVYKKKKNGQKNSNNHNGNIRTDRTRTIESKESKRKKENLKSNETKYSIRQKERTQESILCRYWRKEQNKGRDSIIPVFVSHFCSVCFDTFILPISWCVFSSSVYIYRRFSRWEFLLPAFRLCICLLHEFIVHAHTKKKIYVHFIYACVTCITFYIYCWAFTRMLSSFCFSFFVILKALICAHEIYTEIYQNVLETLELRIELWTKWNGIISSNFHCFQLKFTTVAFSYPFSGLYELTQLLCLSNYRFCWLHISEVSAVSRPVEFVSSLWMLVVNLIESERMAHNEAELAIVVIIEVFCWDAVSRMNNIEADGFWRTVVDFTGNFCETLFNSSFIKLEEPKSSHKIFAL